MPAGSLNAGAAADAGVPHLADLDARRLELAFAAATSGDAERDRRRRQRRELVVVRVRRHDRERHVPGLVLDPVVVRGVRVPLEPEQSPRRSGSPRSMSVTGTRM